MIPSARLLTLTVFCAACFLQAQDPLREGEQLRYSINWPSGLSLGEATLGTARVIPDDGGQALWTFSMQLEASVPGFLVKDEYRSVATEDLCSLEFLKDSTHGKRRTLEKTAFDREKPLATRTTLEGGGSSVIPVDACARDALAFLFFLRRELAKGRLPASQTILFGAAYRIRFRYVGAQPFRRGETLLEADRLIVSLTGPASETTLEVAFARDDARTPVLFKTRLPLGDFTMELAE